VPSTAPDLSSSADQPNGAKLLALLSSPGVSVTEETKCYWNAARRWNSRSSETGKINNPALGTFASPAVGDSTFAAAFNGLGLTSWRVVCARPCTKAPPTATGLSPMWIRCTHISSTGKVTPSLSCWHALATYLSLIDPTLQPDPSCRLPMLVRGAQVAAAARPTAATTTLSVPAGPVTVNITVNVGEKGSASR
jgi:hypothetical protein